MNLTALLSSLLVIFILTMCPIFLLEHFDDMTLYFSTCSYVMLMFIVAFFLFYFITEREKAKHSEKVNYDKINKYLKYNLDDKEVWLVDYENCPNIPSRLKKEGSEKVVCYIFANHTQNERLKNEIRNISTKAIIETIWTSSAGKNLIDIKLAMYTGIINSVYIPSKIIIESKDRGFESLLKACNDFNIYNIEINNPAKTVLVKEEKCKWVYWKIKEDVIGNEISLGNFKKKIKKKVLNITPNEIDYIIKTLESSKYIEILDNKDGKIIKMIKEKIKK